jgi:putative two-component system response regulator
MQSADFRAPKMIAANPVHPHLTIAAAGGRRIAPAWRPPADNAAGTATILIADSADINRRLLRGILKSAPYRILECTRGSQALALLEHEKVDLIIVDMLLPELSGPELCWRLKQDRGKHLIPIIMLTSVQGIENEINGINSGADEFLTKPLHPSVVRTRIRAMLRNKAAIDSLEEAESILFALAQTVEQRDRYTGGHCSRLANFSVAIGTALGLPREDLVALHRGGYLHDIGKISIPDSILFKQGPLTAEEWDVMQSHTIRGEEICRPMRSLAPVLPVIRNHHERWDGTGYPDRLAGEDIPLPARILQLADIYDALVTARPYKRAYTHDEALAVLEEESRLGWRDPELVSVFREVVNLQPEESPATPAVSPEELAMQQSLQNMKRELAK